MRVADGYRPKVKFSVTFSPDILEQLDAYCHSTGIHRTSFIEDAVCKVLEERGGIRSGIEPVRANRDSKHVRKPVCKATNLRASVRKPHRPGK